MNDITKIKVDGELESTYKLFSKNREFEKRAGGGNGGSQSVVQSDWNQNDETAADYVKNRPFYTGDPVETVLVEESTVTFTEDSSGLYLAQFPSTFVATVGKIYKVYWDGSAYECTCAVYNRYPAIGNLSIIGAGSDTGEPFIMTVSNGNGIEIATTDTSASHTISISDATKTIIKIDEKYLPELPYMDKESPTATGSFSLNRKRNTIVGKNSFTEGRDTTASGDTSHAEGRDTTASGDTSHAEGHFTTASGFFSHAEGTETTASAQASHAEGNNTIASSINQHVQGKYNIEDSSNTYAHIVGNGTDYSKRSNAHTLDWKGNAWFAGTIEGKAIILPSSTEGSTKKFKITVDDSGTLTTTEVT